MDHCFRTVRRIEFRDTDAAGIAHFAAFFGFMEEAEHEMMRHLGLSVMTHDAEGTIGWPRVSAKCDYHSPARFEDVLSVDVWIESLGDKAVTYRFEFRKEETLVAEGKFITVCCRVRTCEPPRSIQIPSNMVAKLTPMVRSVVKE